MTKLKKPRSYSDFTLEHLQTMFEIKDKLHPLNLGGQPLNPSDWLTLTLERQIQIPTTTEKAKSEFLISPILAEIHYKNLTKFNLFSGYTFDVASAEALKGRCDFLLARAPYSLNIEAPICAVFEAKDDSLEHWLGQCGAEMYAARRFNQSSHEPLEIIHGAVTNGNEWLFLRLEEQTLWVDTVQYSYRNLPELLGVLQKVIDFYS